ncbi:hypothetical protein SAMD00019534_106740, partial [Acytostelium subglobosum LB1]|uniref:hypothetical protein n=1 Tax=Acytostelium subglobosum LB1 TaxID=1410327 RepID=UPI000644FDBD
MKMMYSLLIVISLVAICGNVINANNPPNVPYSQEIGTQHVLMNYVSYCDTQQILDWTCPRCKNFPGATNIKVVENKELSTFGVVATYNDTVFIAFRGSVDVTNWISNFEFAHVDYPNVTDAKVHFGFYHAWLGVADQSKVALTDSLKECPTCTMIQVLGHSYGAAVSTFCMAEVVQWFPNIPVQSMTIGSPRVGNNVWAEWYNQLQPNTWRVVNQRDVVPHLPPRESVNEYHHVPNEIWYPKNSTTYEVCNDSGEDPSCSDSILPPFYSQADHLDYLGQDCCC